ETARRRKAEIALAEIRARELFDAASTTLSGRRVVVLRESSGPVDRFRPVALAVAALPAAIFLGVIETPPSLLLAASPDSEVDAGSVLGTLLKGFGGRGGGNGEFAQGSLPNPTDLHTAVDALLKVLKYP